MSISVLPRLRSTPPATAPATARIAPHRTAALIGLAAAALSFLGSWIPAPWGDEAASIMSAERSWPSLLNMLGHVDAVHGAYYAFLHVWIDVFGASIVSVRLPSAIAVGVAASGIVVLATRMISPRVGLLAGAIFAMLPRITYMGAEARSYAIGTALVVWLTVLFMRLMSTRTRRTTPWVLYCMLLALSTYVFLYSILMVLVFAAVLVAFARDARLFRRWAAWSGVAIVLSAPVLFFAVAERKQIEFLWKEGSITPYRFFVLQWFSSWWVAVAAWALLSALLVGCGMRIWRRTPHEHDASRRALALAGAWFVIPTAVLLIANTFIAPLYQIRYTTFVTPAIAILLAITLGAVVRSRSTTLIALACIAALITPVFVHQRGPYAKDHGSDWTQLAGVIGSHAEAGDAIVFDESIRPSRRPRLAMHLYPAAFSRVVDVRLKRGYASTTGLQDQTQSIADSAGRIANTNGRLWLIEVRGPSSVGRTERLAQLASLGYRPQSTIELHRDTVYLLTEHDHKE